MIFRVRFKFKDGRLIHEEMRHARSLEFTPDGATMSLNEALTIIGRLSPTDYVTGQAFIIEIEKINAS